MPEVAQPGHERVDAGLEQRFAARAGASRRSASPSRVAGSLAASPPGDRPSTPQPYGEAYVRGAKREVASGCAR